MQSKNGLQNLWEISCSSFSVMDLDVTVHKKKYFLIWHYSFLAILYPTSLANLVVEVGTRHSHPILLSNLSYEECSLTDNARLWKGHVATSVACHVVKALKTTGSWSPNELQWLSLQATRIACCIIVLLTRGSSHILDDGSGRQRRRQRRLAALGNFYFSVCLPVHVWIIKRRPSLSFWFENTVWIITTSP